MMFLLIWQDTQIPIPNMPLFAVPGTRPARFLLQPDAANEVCRRQGAAFGLRLLQYKLRVVIYMQVGYKARGAGL